MADRHEAPMMAYHLGLCFCASKGGQNDWNTFGEDRRPYYSVHPECGYAAKYILLPHAHEHNASFLHVSNDTTIKQYYHVWHSV